MHEPMLFPTRHLAAGESDLRLKATRGLWAAGARLYPGAALLWLVFLMPRAAAAEFIWDGGHPAQDKWSSAHNWNPNGSPDNDGTADLVFTGTVRLTPNADSNWNINSLTFNSAAGAFAIEGSTLTLQGTAVAYALANDSAYTQSLSNALVLGASQTWHANTADLSLSGPITLGANALTLTGGSNFSASGAISGTGSLLKSGAGTLTLSGANTYSGGTTVSAGTLVGDSSSIQGSVTNSAALVFDQATTGTYAGAISGAGSLTKQNTGTLTLSGANTYTGATNVEAGTLAVGATNALSGATAVSVSGGATFQLAASATIGSAAGAGNIALGSHTLTTGGTGASTTFSGDIGGTGALVKTGGGTFTLAGANTYSGGTTVSGGTLQGTTASLQGNIVNDAAVVFDQTGAGAYGGTMSGSGSLTKQNSGTVTLTGANTFTGGTVVTAGTLALGGSNTLADTGAVTIADGGTLQLTAASETVGSISGAGGIVLGSHTLTAGGDNTSTTFSGAIDGTGGLTKTGSGTLTLGGTNTYSGGTTVSAGTLQGTTTSLQGNITNHAAVVFDQTPDGTYAGAMSGTGTLIKNNGSTLTLTGTNTYSGGTTVNAGTLRGTTSSLQGNIVNQAAVVFDQAGNGTYSGALSGSGSLAKEGSGTVILTGANTYSGGTTISAGTLQGNTTSLQGNITNHAALVFDQAANGTYSGAISGTGSLTKQNGGTLVLTGANSYSGGTTVSAGALQGDTTSLQGNIVNHAAVVFDQAASGTFSGAISGTGSLAKQNAGTLVLTGANAYSGGTTVSAGVLQGDATSLQGNIANHAAVVFDQAANGTYTGAISGTGGITKQNTGTLTLAGTNTFTGATTVNGGTLALGANNAFSAASNLTLATGSTVSLAGFSAEVGLLAYHTAIVDFGAAGTTNYFLFNGGNTSSGTLTIDNYSTADGDIFAFRSGSTGVSNSFVEGVYFYGIGSGTFGATGQTIGGYSGTWDFINPGAAVFKTWDGGGNNNQWGTAANWDDDTAPAGNFTLKLAFDGSARTAPVLDSNLNLNTLRFDAGAASFSLGASGANALTFGGTVPGIIQLSANAQSIDVPLVLNNTVIVETSGAGTLTVAGDVSGAGGINKIGGSTLVLAGANSYAGATTVGAGTLVLQDSAALGSTAAGTSVSAGATLQLENNIAIGDESLALAGTLRNASGTNSYAGAISGNGSVTVEAGTLTLDGTSSNTYGGATNVNGGTLELDKSGSATAVSGNLVIGTGAGAATVRLLGNNQIADTSVVTLGAGGTPVFDLNGHAETIGSLASANSSAAVQLGTGGALTTGGDGTSTTFAGVISGAGNLTKTGAGTFTLSGGNTHSGTTAVDAGTLVVRSSSALGSTAGGTSVAGGAVLQLENNVAIGAESLALSGTLANASGSNSFGGAISGAGSVTVDGGTLALTGTTANTFAGPTTVNAGTLDLGKSANVTAVSGNLVIGTGVGAATTRLLASEQISDTAAVTLGAGGTPILNLNGHAETIGSLASTNASAAVQLGTGGSLAVGGDNASTTFAGTISGAGSLTKQGSGQLTLAGANTYSGGTTVSAGTLQGDATSLQGSIANNAAVVFDQSANGTYAGAMSGTGSLTKQNTGTLILTGANSYSGGTTVSAGTLQGNSTSLQGDIANHAAVVFDQSSTGTYAGAISGTGSLTKQNTGTLILAGANTYSGGTTVAAGTLQGDTTSLQGNIANSGSLVFDQAADGTFGGAISGTGSVTKQSTGTLVLTGANTYSGGTTVSAGTLQGDTTSLQGGIANNAAVAFNQAADGTYSGVMSGTGALTKDGTGTLTLSGANTYSGATTVNAGTLALGASNRLSDSTDLTLGSGTTLLLSGAYSERVDTLSFTDASVNFGTTGTANFLLLGNAGSHSGTLTISNWSSGSDVFGIATNAVSQSFLDNIFFSGINVGIGATLSSTTTNVAGYGSFYTVTPIATFVWDGGKNNGPTSSQDDWSQGQNWTGNIAPGVAADKAVVMAGSVKTTTDMNGAYQLRSLLFRSDAGAFTLNSSTGDTMTVNGGGIVNQSTATQTLNVSLSLGAAQTWSATSGDLVFSGASILNGANTLTVTGDYDTTINSVVGSGSGGIVKNGAGTLTLNGANTFTGSVNVAAGTLAVRNSTALGSTAAGTSVASGATLQLENNVAVGAESLALTGTLRNASGANSYGGAISGTGTVVVDGGTLGLSGSAANTYTGATTVNTGTLQLNKTAGVNAIAGNVTIGNGSGTAELRLLASNQISDTSTVTLASGGTPVFNLNGQSEAIGGLASTNASATVQLGTGNLTVGTGNVSSTYGGIIAGTGSLTKQGAGTFTLNGSNSTYSGSTTVSQGTLQIDADAPSGAAGALGNSTAAVVLNDANTGTNNTALLAGLSGVTIGRDISVANSGTGTTTLGSALTSGTANFTGNITLNRAAALQANGTANVTFSGGAIGGLGGITKTGAGTVTLLGNNTYSGGTHVGTGTLAVGTDAALGTGAVTFTTGGILQAAANGVTIGNALTLTGATATVDTNAHTFTLSGVIGSTGALAKTGLGTLVYTGTNTYSGSTTIGAGTLQIGNGGTSGSFGSGSVTNNAALVFNRADTYVAANAIGGTGTLTQAGTGTTVLAGNNTYSGATTIASGTLQIGNGGTTGTIGSGTITNHGALMVNRSNSYSLPGSISGTGSFTQAGTGTTIFSTANTYSGATTISAGTLQIGAGGTTGTLGSANVTNDGALAFNRSNTHTVSNAISGTGAVNQIGAGTTILTGANTYSGTTAISGGTLQIGAGGTAGTMGTGAVTNNGTLVFNRSDAYVVNNAIGGTGNLIKNGSGTTTLTSANTYSGATTVNSGVLAIQHGAALGSTAGGTTVSAGAALHLAGGIAVGAESIGLAGFGIAPGNLGALRNISGNNSIAGPLTLLAATRIQVDSGTLTLSGGISGAGLDLTIGGTGDTILAGAFAFGTGTLTKVDAGNLTFESNVNFSSGTLTLDGGTLTLAGINLTVGTLRITGDTILDFGNSAASTLNATNLIVDAGVSVTISNWVEYVDLFRTDNWQGATPDTTNSAPMNQVTFDGFPGSDTRWRDLGGEITPTPEPATYGALLLSALAALLYWRRRKR